MQDNDLTNIIQQAQEKGLIAISPFGLRGTSEAVFRFLDLMTNTTQMETSCSWWQVRLWLVRN